MSDVEESSSSSSSGDTVRDVKKVDAWINCDLSESSSDSGRYEYSEAGGGFNREEYEATLTAQAGPSGDQIPPDQAVEPPEPDPQRLALKAAVADLLSCALAADETIRRLTEQRIKALELTEAYPFILIEVIRNEEEAIDEKMMAATFLKNLIIDVYGRPNMVQYNSTQKEQLQCEMFGLLVVPNSALRSTVSSALELLVVKEYPESIFTINNMCLVSLNQIRQADVIGCVTFMRGLLENHHEFCMDNNFFSLDNVDPLINVLQNEDIFSTEVRSNAIFCLMHILVACNGDRTMYFMSLLGRVGKMFQHYLQSEHTETNNFVLMTKIIQAVSHAVDYLKTEVADFADFVKLLLPSIGQILSDCCEAVKEVVMEKKPVPKDSDETTPENFEQLLQSIILLMNKIYTSQLKHLLDPGIKEFVYCLFILMLCFNRPVESLFNEDYIDETPESDHSLRGRCGHTLMIFMDDINYDIFVEIIIEVVQKLTEEARCYITTNHSFYVQLCEVTMYGVGIYSYVYEIPVDKLINQIHIWSRILIPGRHQDWLLLARLFWLGGKYSLSLCLDTFHNHMRSILNEYSSPNPALKLAAFEALRTHLAKIGQSENRTTLLTLSYRVLKILFGANFANRTYAIIGFQGLTHFFKYFHLHCTTNCRRLISLLMNEVHRYLSDAGVIKEINCLLTVMVLNGDCVGMVIKDFVPFVYSLVRRPDPRTRSVRPIDAPERGFELLNTVIKFHPEAVNKDITIYGFTEACRYITECADDNAVESATIFITNLLMKDSCQIKDTVDDKGKPLPSYIPQVLFKLLEYHPQEPTCPSKFGRFCVISIMTLPDYIQPCMEAILKALLSAMQRAKTDETLQSYCFIFAYMFSWQPGNTVKFLSGIPGPDGRSALCYFLNKWKIEMLHCDRFERNIQIVAICKMIEYSINEDDDTINKCLVELNGVFAGTCSGMEKLYICLIEIFLRELQRIEDFEDSDTDDVLIQNHPVWNLDVLTHIREFVTHYNSMHFYQVLKVFYKNNEKRVEDFKNLSANGMIPGSGQ